MSIANSRDELASLFGWVDYTVFGLMLAFSAGIGVFYGCFRKIQNTDDFLMAGRSMTTIPVAMSLIASFMSAITLLGTPSEIYQYGFVYWLIGFSYFFVMPVAAYLYLPVFWDLQVTSAYEYLEKRFSGAVRRLGSMVFIIQMSLYMAIVVYAPALALSQVTGMNVYLSVSLICFVCIFYTTLGGMKAVLWTDTLQVAIMYVSMVFIIIKGAIDEGGFAHVWEVGTRGGRTDLVDWDPKPTTRHTFWTLIIGGYFTWITIYGVNQAQVQRYLCVQKEYMAVRALWINLIGLFMLMILCAFGGLVIYAKYENCDPVASGLVEKNDQLLPIFVMANFGHLKGLPGLFVAGIFSGALSTVSSGMNSLAAITLEDFIKPCFPLMNDKVSTITSKVMSLFFGVLTFGLVFVAEQLGNILAAALSIFGMVGGPLHGVFALGLFFPWANSIGAFVGTLGGLVLTFWVGVGHQLAKQSGDIYLEPKVTSVSGCTNFTSEVLQNATSATAAETPTDGLTEFYKLSYMWYSALGTFSVIVIGLLVSLVTKPRDVKTLNPKVISPLIHWCNCIIPGAKNIGIYYNESETEGLQHTRSSASLGNGHANIAFDDHHSALPYATNILNQHNEISKL